MKSWYENIVVIMLVLLISFILEIFKKRTIRSMFEVNDIKTELSSVGSVLLIIAHPDDEIMFWTPTIKALIDYKIPMKILCLSNGNYDGLGELREKEFDNVSRALNLPDNQILNIPELQDNIKQYWEPKIVSEQIEEFLKDNTDVKTIITFDNNGVTKHPNHISCFNGLIYYLRNHLNESKNKGLKIYTLDSFNFPLQYSIFIPLFSSIFKKYGFYSMTCFSSYKWMRLYETQFNLLRKAHVILSGYSYFNSFNRIELNDKSYFK